MLTQRQLALRACQPSVARLQTLHANDLLLSRRPDDQRLIEEDQLSGLDITNGLGISALGGAMADAEGQALAGRPQVVLIVCL